MEETVSIEKKSIVMTAVVLVFVVVFIILLFSYQVNPFDISLVLSFLMIAWGGFYFYKSSEKLNEMCCMMNGMVFSMMAGFAIGAIIALPAGDFILGIFAGTFVALAIGIVLGNLGGGLGRMEGIMAAPMGGTMGAMLGVMIRFYNVQLFMQFLLIMLLVTVVEMTRVNHANIKHMSKNMIYSGAVISFLVLISAFMLTFQVNATTADIVLAKDASPAVNAAEIKNGVQEITIRAEAAGYNPDYVTVKKGVPVKLNLQAAPNAGCTRSIVFPDFGISRTLSPGGSDTVTFTPNKAGTFDFRCSMAMARGKIVVQN